MLKHTNYLDRKDPWKDAEIRNYYKHDRFEAKREIDNSIMEYNENSKANNVEKIYYLREQLANCNNDIYEIEELLRDLPERLEGLKMIKKEIEEEICWTQLKNK